MWSNDFEGEAFLEIAKLPGIPHESAHDNRPFDELKQIELPLTHPKGTVATMLQTTCSNVALF